MHVVLRTVVPNLLAPVAGFVEDNFSGDQCMCRGQGDGFGMIQVYYSYCALCFYYYYISFTSYHQTLDPRSSDMGTPG